MRKISISDVLIVGALSLFVAGVTLVAFASKAIKYEQSNNSVALTVQKTIFNVNAQTGGVLVDSYISVGQHVQKGQLIGNLVNDSLDRQIAALSALTDNASAQVQLSQLQAEKASLVLYSPTNGIVASTSSEGEAINDSQKIATIYSDDSVQLIGKFDYANYNLFTQNTSNLTALSTRDGKTYPIEYGGTYQDTSTDSNKTSYVTLFFTLTNPSDAINVLEGETMDMKIVNTSGSTKPIDRFLNWYSNSIFNQQ